MPLKFKKLLGIPNKISQVVLLGNCTKSYEFLKFVNDISPNVTFVRGEFDCAQLPTTRKNRNKEGIPMDTIIKQGDFKIGCCSGYTVVPKNDPLSLLALARQLDVDILLWGGTHNVEAYTLEGKFFVNPGSCTGAFNTDWPILGEDEITTKKEAHSSSEREQQQIKINDQEATQPAEMEKAASNEDIAPESKKKKDETNDDRTVVGAKDDNDKDQELDKDKDEDEDFEIADLDIEGSNVPSFCLLDIQGATLSLIHI